MRIILIEPLYEINIGKICRVMKNFGYKELYLVNPQIKLGKETEKYALHAKDILKNVKIVKTLDEAVKGVYPLIGTTANYEKGRKGLSESLPLSEINWYTKENIKKMGIVFGREDMGLNREILLKCDHSVYIETSKEYPSMNLSNAVSVVLYHFRLKERKCKSKKVDSKIVNVLEKEYNKIVDSIDLKHPKKCKKAFSNLIKRNVSNEELTSIICVIKEINKNKK